jgi:alkylation response protein AidB-like acyl-CoA dehydrogenase
VTDLAASGLRITPDADTEELRAVVRAFLQRHCDTEAVFREMDGRRGWDPAVWRRFAGELGAVALDVPEELGGAGASFREVAVVAEELGRSLVRLPWFSTAVLGVGVLLHAAGDGADAARTELLPALASGEVTAALAHAEETAGERTRAEPDGEHWRLTGSKTRVIEGATADLILVSASTGAGIGLFAVSSGAAGVTRTPQRALDPNRQLASLTLEDAPARAVGDPSAGGPVLERVRDRAVTALACEQTGGTSAALDMTVAHAKERIQFGRPIGSFQAIKHRCADMAVALESARSASSWAAAAAADTPEDLPLAAATAALACAEAYSFVAAETIQVHGGIGFTWEHPAHLHFRRAATGATLFGDQAVHRERVLRTLGV